MNEIVSVVVPIYNVEKYLKRCIDSIINQSYQYLEIILVNDGSTDGCKQICKDYIKKDYRIKFIDKKNGGLSDARNKGISEATGRYITFIDSDDFIDKEYVKTLVDIIIHNNCDIACCDFYPFQEDEETKINYIDRERKIQVYDKVKALEAMMYKKNMRNSACAKLFKKELFNKIQFPKGKLCEDLGTVYKLLDLSNKTCIINCKYYYYMQRKGSIIHSHFNINRMDGLYFAREQKDFIIENYPQIIDAAYNREFMEAIYILIIIPYNKKFKKQIIQIKESIKNNRNRVIKDKKAPLKTRLLALFSYFCIRNLKLLLNLKY